MDEVVKPEKKKRGPKKGAATAVVSEVVENVEHTGPGAKRRERINVLAYLRSVGYDPIERLRQHSINAEARGDHKLAADIDKDLTRYCAAPFKHQDADEGQNMNELMEQFLAFMAFQGRPKPPTDNPTEQ